MFFRIHPWWSYSSRLKCSELWKHREILMAEKLWVYNRVIIRSSAKHIMASILTNFCRSKDSIICKFFKFHKISAVNFARRNPDWLKAILKSGILCMLSSRRKQKKSGLFKWFLCFEVFFALMMYQQHSSLSSWKIPNSYPRTVWYLLKKGRILPMQPLVPPGYQSLLSCAFAKPLIALLFLLLKFSYISLPDMGYNEKKIKKSHTHRREREREQKPCDLPGAILWVEIHDPGGACCPLGTRRVAVANSKKRTDRGKRHIPSHRRWGPSSSWRRPRVWDPCRFLQPLPNPKPESDYTKEKEKRIGGCHESSTDESQIEKETQGPWNRNGLIRS